MAKLEAFWYPELQLLIHLCFICNCELGWLKIACCIIFYRLKSEEIEEVGRTTTSSKCIPEDATKEEEEVSAATIAHCATSTTNKKESVTCTGTRVSKVTILEMPVKTEAVAKSKSLFPLFYRPKKVLLYIIAWTSPVLWNLKKFMTIFPNCFTNPSFDLDCRLCI